MIDKITILEIKNARIADAAALANVRRELDALNVVAAGLDLTPELAEARDGLRAVNATWTCWDAVRARGSGGFRRRLHRAGPRRRRAQRRARRAQAPDRCLSGSALVEEKSYPAPPRPDTPRPDPPRRRLTLFAKGNLDLRDTLHSLWWRWRSALERHQCAAARSRCAAVDPREARNQPAQRDVLAADGTIPAELAARDLPLDPHGLRVQFGTTLFTERPDAYVLSLQPDIQMPLALRRGGDYAFYPHGVEAWPPEQRQWLRDGFTLSRSIGIDNRGQFPRDHRPPARGQRRADPGLQRVRAGAGRKHPLLCRDGRPLFHAHPPVQSCPCRAIAANWHLDRRCRWRHHHAWGAGAEIRYDPPQPGRLPGRGGGSVARAAGSRPA